MRRSALLFLVVALMPAILVGQLTFEDLVDRAFGSDQNLVNGIQFSNQYIRIEGSPYFAGAPNYIEGWFRIGSVCINEQCYEQVRLRYNLYTQKVEIEYVSQEGNLNQILTVPEHIPRFTLEGFEFRRMQIGEDDPMYYMMLSSGSTNCYIGWSKEVLGGGSSPQRFSEPQRTYWIEHGEQWITFDDKKSYIRAFPPERQKEFKALLKREKFMFNIATTGEMVDMIGETMHMLEEGEGI
jgi:hypothetical protein